LSRAAILKKSYLLSRSGTHELAAEFEHGMLVVPRGELVYCCLEVGNIPPARRAQYIERQRLKYSPFADGSYFVHQQAGKAQLWIWDGAWEKRCRAELPAGSDRLEALPESVLHPPGDSGFQLVACADGYDLQHWREGVLLASRFFRSSPDAADRLRFAQGCNDVAAAEFPAVALQWLPRPWTFIPSSWKNWLRDEKLIYPAIAAALAFVIFLQLGVVMAVMVRESLAERRIESLRSGLVARLDMQQQAELTRIVNSEWRQLVGAPSQLELLAEVTAKLGFANYELAEWDYNSGSLRLVISDPNAKTREYVTRLAQSSFFDSVRIEPGTREGENVLTMRVIAAAATEGT
jgi:hypothetical protein